ncbi:DUF1871 family protein [Mammaliicoccus vitulinus]
MEDISELTNKFQEIYAFSFDTTIDIDSCKQMAIKATALQSSCEI